MAGIVFSKSSGVAESMYGRTQEPIFALIEEQTEAWQKGRSCIDKIFCMEHTNNFVEKFTSETALGNFAPVGEAGAYPENGWQEGYSTVMEPDTWKNKFEVTMEMVEDAKHGKIKQKASAFTLSFNRTRELFAAKMLMGGVGDSIQFGVGSKQRAFSTKGADGLPFFSKEHPSITGGTGPQSNKFANAFSYNTLCRVQASMQSYTDEDGNLLGIQPNTIIIPNDAMLKKAVMNAIGAEGLPDSSNNSFNFQYGLWNVIIWPFLNQFLPSNATSTPWLLMDSDFNAAEYGAVWLDRIGLQIRSEIAENDNNVFKGRARFTAGFNNWRPFAISYEGSDGTTLPIN